MIQKLASTNIARAVLYAIVLMPFLFVVNTLSPDSAREVFRTMPSPVQALVLINGVLSLYILAARNKMQPIFFRR